MSGILDWRSATRLAAGVAGALFLILALLALTSDNVPASVDGLLTGAVSSPGRTAQWLSYSSYLMFTGASVCLVFRVGMFSIGAEGQVFIAALTSGVVALALGPSAFALPLAVLAAAVGGAAWALLPGLMKAYLNADEIVTTLMLNFVATFAFAFVIKEALLPEGAGFPVSEYFDKASWLPKWGTSPAIPSSLVLAILSCVAVSVLLNRSRLGFRLRMVGDSRPFARANGYPVRRLICVAFVVSGAVAGLAGAAIAFGGTHRLIVGMGAGIGFEGVLVALLAVNRPALVPLTALAYGYLRTGGEIIQITGNVPRDVVVVLQGLLIIGLAALLRRRDARSRTPMKAAPVDTLDHQSAGRHHRGDR
ncbi:ABC transporter permease [Nonomuraea endophytica]|uniref:ABC transporter permease n=1 Tax=Nonomuraea endophytica TaxID=714136 RepID=UPI0037CBF025